MDDCGRNIRKNEDGKKNWEIVMVNSRERYSDEQLVRYKRFFMIVSQFLV